MKSPFAITILLAYGVMSLLTYTIYAFDKKWAKTKERRIQERVLHTCEFLGGWPGAFVAQRILRHKTKKMSYQAVFWSIVLVHAAFWTDALVFKRFVTFMR